MTALDDPGINALFREAHRRASSLAHGLASTDAGLSLRNQIDTLIDLALEAAETAEAITNLVNELLKRAEAE